MCGRARGYQKGSTKAFDPALSDGRTINEGYLDGLSITYRNRSRQHIWTFTSGYTESTTYSRTYNCPCTTNSEFTTPDYVGSHYYCESGTMTDPFSIVYTADPLWEGKDCDNEGTCCDDGLLPWFYRKLDQATQDDIEARICSENRFNYGSTLINQLELYIQ